MSFTLDLSIISDIIDILRDVLDNEQKEEVYSKLVKILDANGVEDIDEFEGVDSEFDEIAKEYFEAYDDADNYSNEDLELD
jgi:flagellin-specific chaperone FliS